MARKLKDNDYLYATARIRALEAGLIGQDKLERMLEARTAADAMAQVGMNEGGADPAAREAWFSARLAEAYAVVLEMLPAPDAVRFMQYPYDCNHIKAALKCRVRGIDPTPMLMECGSLPAEQCVAMARDGAYSALPAAMAAGAAQAVEVYTATGDPQMFDLILDRACFADMRAAAVDAYTAGLVCTKIDLTNLMIFLRVLRMGLTPANRAMLEAALLDGGEIARDRFLSAAAGGEAGLAEALAGTVCAEVLDAFADHEGQPSLAALERACDDAWMARVTDAKYIPFGAAVPVAYLAAWEYAVKNMRIICAGKDAGLETDTIRERMRASYV